VESRERKWIGMLGQEGLRGGRIRIKQVARHEETAVGVHAHASERLLTALEQDEVRKDAPSGDPPGARLDVRPRDARPASANRLPWVAPEGENLAHDAVALFCRQGFDTLEKLRHGHAIIVTSSVAADKLSLALSGGPRGGE
jgi:hypothetical protein